MALTKLFSKTSSQVPVRETKEWILNHVEVRHWRSLVSKQNNVYVKELQKYLGTNLLYIGVNTFASGFILVLHQACRSASVDFVRYVVNCHTDQFDFNQLVLYHPVPFRYYTSQDKRISAMERVRHRKTSLLHAAAEGGSVVILKLLISKGASINIPDCCSKIPLMTAIQNNKKDAVLYLIGAGANINWQDDMGKTPLMYAVSFSMLTFCKIPSILVKAGADVSITNCGGHTVMHEAVMYDTLYNFCDPSKSNRTIMLANLGISPWLKLTPSSIPAAYIVDQRMIMANYIQHGQEIKEILAVFTKHSDCSPENAINMLLLEGTYEFYLHIFQIKLKQPSSFNRVENTLKLFEKAFEMRVACKLNCSFQVKEMYQGRIEIQCTEELERFKDTENRDTICELAYQCLMIRERCLGYGDMTLIKCLFIFGEWMFSNLFKESAVLLWSHGTEMVLTKLRSSAAALELFHLNDLISLASKVCMESLCSDVHAVKEIELQANLLIPFVQNLIECLHLYINIYRHRHCHINESFHSGILYLLILLQTLFNTPIQDIDISLLGMELVSKCPRFIGPTGRLTTVLELAIDSLNKDLKFLEVLLEWGASKCINVVGAYAFRLINRVEDEDIRKLLLEYGAHPDASFEPEVCPYSSLMKDHPKPLTCLAATIIIWESIPYRSLDIPPHIMKFIALHDPDDIQMSEKEELGSLI